MTESNAIYFDRQAELDTASVPLLTRCRHR